MKYRLVVGIDPDIKLSGIAIWDELYKKYVTVCTLPFEDIFDEIQAIAERYRVGIKDVIIYVESGWKNDKANFRSGQKSSVSEKIAMNVGMNHATSILTSRMLKKHGWHVVEIAPLLKGNGLFKNLRGWTETGRKHIQDKTGFKNLNDEKRDALYIVESFKLRD